MNPPEGAKSVVVIGGGTGISSVLKGLKRAPVDLTAIVTVGDDGGSSGRLRKDYRMSPPGDIRNCLVAMSEADPLVEKLLEYRFEDAILKGHSFGNLLLVVLTQLEGDFRKAVDWAADFLQVRGRVIPSTDCRVVLVASHPDGTRTTGEQRISECRKAITQMALLPTPPAVSSEITEALRLADLVVLGPGSLFTSIIPNLLVPGFAAALEACMGKIVLVSNLMTQPGETDGLSLSDHLQALKQVGSLHRLDYLLADNSEVSDAVKTRYAEAGATLIRDSDLESGILDGVSVIHRPIADLTPSGHWRHHPESLAEALLGILSQQEIHDES
ncbi:MAG TPA: YvcK family protein [Planctomycetota bacterium]|nr:YvcK family protein [Planctomycetota bacterium]